MKTLVLWFKDFKKELKQFHQQIKKKVFMQFIHKCKKKDLRRDFTFNLFYRKSFSFVIILFNHEVNSINYSMAKLKLINQLFTIHKLTYAQTQRRLSLMKTYKKKIQFITYKKAQLF